MLYTFNLHIRILSTAASTSLATIVVHKRRCISWSHGPDPQRVIVLSRAELECG
jgi:hypothetical protein